MTIETTAVHGFNYQVVFDGTDISGQSNSTSLSPSKNSDDVTPFGVEWKLKVAGIKDWKGQLKIFYNEESAEAMLLLWNSFIGNSANNLQLSPKGGEVGDWAWSGSVIVSGISHEASPDGGAVAVTIDFEGSGTLTFGLITAKTTVTLTATTTGVGVDWSNPNNILIEDTALATCNLTAGSPDSRYLVAKISNPSIPTDCIITGLTATVKRLSWAETVKDLHILLINGSTVISGGDDKADTATNWPASLTNKVYGSEHDDWDAGLTPALLNGGTIGVAIAAQRVSGATATAGVDFVDVDIYYINPD